MIVFVVSPPLQPPFCGGNREKIQQKIVKDKIKLPGYLSSEAHALLKGVISSPQNIFSSIILDQIHHHLKIILFAT
jgi:p70 ribosomal S6 kinase